MTPGRVDAAAWQMLEHFAEVVLRRGMEIEVKDDTQNQLSFHYRGREYVALCIPAEGLVPSIMVMDSDKHFIFLLNRCH